MSQARKEYKETKKASIRVFKLYYHLGSNNMLKSETAMHPIDKTEYRTAGVPEDFADHREWNYLINRLKYERCLALTNLYNVSGELGNKMLGKINEMRGEHRLTRDNIMHHMAHHKITANSQEGQVDKARVDRLLKTVDETRMGLIKSIILHFHYL